MKAEAVSGRGEEWSAAPGPRDLQGQHTAADSCGDC